MTPSWTEPSETTLHGPKRKSALSPNWQSGLIGVSTMTSKDGEKRFCIGDRVKWTNGGSGHERTKRGTVLQVIPTGGYWSPLGVAVACKEKFGKEPAFAAVPPTNARKHESYLVIVPPKIEGRAPRLYWPFTSKLERDTGEE
jgi:hypothetical protein